MKRTHGGQRRPSDPPRLSAIVVHADVPMAVFDEFRQVVILPIGLDAAARVKALTELYEERRGGWSP